MGQPSDHDQSSMGQGALSTSGARQGQPPAAHQGSGVSRVEGFTGAIAEQATSDGLVRCPCRVAVPSWGRTRGGKGTVPSVAHFNSAGLASYPLRIQPQRTQRAQRSRFTQGPPGRNGMAQGQARRRPGCASRNPPLGLNGRNAVLVAKCQRYGTAPIGPRPISTPVPHLPPAAPTRGGEESPLGVPASAGGAVIPSSAHGVSTQRLRVDAPPPEGGTPNFAPASRPL